MCQLLAKFKFWGKNRKYIIGAVTRALRWVYHCVCQGQGGVPFLLLTLYSLHLYLHLHLYFYLHLYYYLHLQLHLYICICWVCQGQRGVSCFASHSIFIQPAIAAAFSGQPVIWGCKIGYNPILSPWGLPVMLELGSSAVHIVQIISVLMLFWVVFGD